MIKEFIPTSDSNVIALRQTLSKVRYGLKYGNKENSFVYNGEIVTFGNEYEGVVGEERVSIKKVKNGIEVLFLDLNENKTFWQKIKMFFKIKTI